MSKNPEESPKRARYMSKSYPLRWCTDRFVAWYCIAVFNKATRQSLKVVVESKELAVVVVNDVKAGRKCDVAARDREWPGHADLGNRRALSVTLSHTTVPLPSWGRTRLQSSRTAVAVPCLVMEVEWKQSTREGSKAYESEAAHPQEVSPRQSVRRRQG